MFYNGRLQCVDVYGGIFMPNMVVHGDQCCEESASFSESERSRNSSVIEPSQKKREEGS
jgi:hypothetical protein